MVWTCSAQHRLDCRSTQAECGCTEKIWQAEEIMGWSAWEWQKEARYGFCWPSKSFWMERTPSRKTCQKAQPSKEENRALKWIWWWWWLWLIFRLNVFYCYSCWKLFTLNSAWIIKIKCITDIDQSVKNMWLITAQVIKIKIMILCICITLLIITFSVIIVK